MLIALFFLSVRSTPKCNFGTARTVEIGDERNPLRAHLFQRNRKETIYVKSLQHRTLFSPPEISTTEHCFCFGSASSFFLEIFLHFSSNTYQPGGAHILVSSFGFFTLFMVFWKQEYWSGLPSLKGHEASLVAQLVKNLPAM